MHRTYNDNIVLPAEAPLGGGAGATGVSGSVQEGRVSPEAIKNICRLTGFEPEVESKPSSTGIKHDQGKTELHLLSTIAVTKVAEVMSFGKIKYAEHNWRGGFSWSRPLSAALRHIFAYIGGEDKDPESGLSHLAHAACCIFFLLEFEETHRHLDDRYKGAVDASNKK